MDFFKDILELFKGYNTDDLKKITMAFSFVKLTDDALKYSKLNIIKQYESSKNISEKLFNQAVCPNEEKLGFYNYSKWDLKKLSEVNESNLSNEFQNYLNSFSDNVKQLLDYLNFFDFVNLLSDDNLKGIINKLNDIDIDEKNFYSHKALNNYYNLFLMEFKEYFEISDYISFINTVFLECYLNKDDKVFIDICDDAFFISNSNDKNWQDNIYLFDNDDEKLTIALSRMILADVKLSHMAGESIFSSDSFDLMISHNFGENSINENLEKYVKKLDDCEKIIFTVVSDELNDCLSTISQISNGDIIEAVISLPVYEDYNLSAIVLANNKKNIPEGSFLLINESGLLNENKHVTNWKFIVSKLSKIIKNQYLSPDNLISYKFNELDECEEFFEELGISLKKSEKVGLSKRKRVRSDKIRYDYNFDDVDVNDLMEASSDFSNVNVLSIGLQGKNIIQFNFEKNRPNLNEFIKNASKFIDGDVEIIEISQIANLVEVTALDDDSLYFSNCNLCNGGLVFFGYELKDLNCHDFIKIDLSCDFINLNYLKIYLNSKTGLNEISYSTNNFNFLNPARLGNVRIAYPSLENQMDIIKAFQDGNEFLKSIKGLIDNFQDNIFDYKKMVKSIDEFRGQIKLDSQGFNITEMDHNWRNVYSKLIWPLAITYLSATRGVFEKSEKANRYLILFEFIAAFNSIVLISGLPEEVYDEYKYSKIWNDESEKKYKSMPFGNWTYLSKNLSQLYKKQDFTTDFDRKLFDAISSSKINSLLNKTREIRNDKVHGAMPTPKESELLLEILDAHLSEIFEILNIYSDYKLFYVLGIYEAGDDGLVKNRVIHLNGACKQPIYGYINFNGMLEKGELFLYNPINNKLLKLNSNLIKFKPIDEFEKQWGIYIFNGFFNTKKGKCIAKYKNFQENDDEYTLKITSFREDIVG